MRVRTRHFGEIDLDESKIIYFENGIMGFEECKRYTILYDETDGERPIISWLQNLEETTLAIPIISPFIVKSDFNPKVDDEFLKELGDLNQENMLVLVSVTVPATLENISANLKAPFIINTDLRIGAQIIAENSDYEVKYCFYDQLMKYKAEKEGE